MATLTGGRTARTALSGGDTPETAAKLLAAVWRSVTLFIAGTPHVRVSRDGGRTYPARLARKLPAEVPGQPCTVPVFDAGTGTGRLLVLDLDPGSGDLDRQADELGQLLERLGGRYVSDVSPSGGRHVLVLFAAALPWLELRDLVRAMAIRFPSVDTAPMSSLGGQISPPGSRHKSGGWRLLSMPLKEARAAVEHPNGPEIWNALLEEFAAELHQVLLQHGDDNSVSELDDTGVPWIPRLGGRAPLSPELEQVARTGGTRGRGRSEARIAILNAAAARGWQLADVLEAVSSGTWKGFPSLYYRASEPGRMERLLPYEWRKAVAFAGGEKNVRHWHTSNLYPRPPVGESSLSAEYGLTRQWVTAIACALEDRERVKGWGGRGIAVRLVLLALAQAAMVSGSSTVEFGCRNLALHAAVSHRTVARVLRLLAAEPDPLIDLVSPRRAARADRYQLRIPGRYADSARWRRRRAGRIEAAHPVFLALGGAAGLVYQVLDGTEARGATVARAARLSPSAVSAALRVLAEYGLAERGRGGWKRGPVGLDDVAESSGAADLQRDREARYKKDRESWQARLRRYASARNALVAPGDGWWPMDDEDDWTAMLLSRWPVLSDNFVRGPPGKASTHDVA